MNEYVKLSIWVAVVGALFAWLWRRGDLVRFSLFVQETREELRKCSWPTWDELRGSTVVVMVSIVLLGTFTVLVDYILHLVVQKMLML